MPPSRPILTQETTQDTFAAIQEDGSITFVDESVLFSAIIPVNLRGTAYHVLAAGSVSAKLLVSQGMNLIVITCSKTSKSCTSTGSPIHLPLTSADVPVIAIKPMDDGDSDLILASLDTIIAFDSSRMRVYDHYTLITQTKLRLNAVSGMRFVGTGDDYILVAYVNSVNVSEPGKVVRLAYDGSRLSRPVVTFMTMSPFNFLVSRDDNTIKYWTQMNTTTHKAYINSVGGFSLAGPAKPVLHAGEIISPSFMGEYVMIQIGAIVIGDPTQLGFDLQCLHFGYGMSSGPEVSITERYRASRTLGLPFLAIQPEHLSAEMIAISKTSKGYSVVSIGFSGCPMGGFASSSSSSSNYNSHSRISSKSTQTSHIKPKSRQIRLSVSDMDPVSYRSENDGITVAYQPKHISNKSSPNRLHTFFKPNCELSGCSIDYPADCPQEHCWGNGASGQFLCCVHPPV